MSRILSSLRYPLIQAPMAFAHDTELPLAVGKTGALGSLASAMYDAAGLEKALARMKQEGGDRPYNLNFFAHRMPSADRAHQDAWFGVLRPYFGAYGLTENDIPTGGGRQPFDADALACVERYRPPVVSFHFGLPAPEYLQRVKATGAEVWSSATTVEEAVWLEQNGADVVIAQAWEAGGHRGWFLNRNPDSQSGLFALLPAIRNAVRLPVIAAGGVSDAAAVRAALELGASAVQVGTAFLLADEALTKPAHRAAIQTARPEDTVVTNLFSGGAARGLYNRFIREAGPMNDAALPFPLAGAAAGALKATAEKQGCYDFSPFWAGQNAGLCRPGSAAEIVERLCGSIER